jgi:signal transduction histidine kinase
MNGASAGPPTERDLAQRWFAAASHELRTPLAGLRAELEEARLHPDQTDLPQVLDAALRGVGRLEAIVDDLFLLSQVAEDTWGRHHLVDLAAVARAHAVPSAACPEVRLRAAEPVIVDAAPTLLDRLVANLLDNARRYARQVIEIQVLRQGSTAELVVTDDGPGIPAPERERVFERFFRPDGARCRRRGGVGLGLAIARDIAHAHNGTLHVEEAAGAGARFVLRLPVAGHAAGR